MSPVLAEEINLYPETLLSDDNPEEQGELICLDRQWWVAHTRTRQEKVVARELYRQQIPFYLPLVEMTRVYRGWRVTSRSPLFNGYVFVYASEEERVKSLYTNRVWTVLPVPDPERLRRDLCQISRLIASKAPLTLESRLAAGSRVRVRSGSFAGMEGTVATRRGKTRLVVHVDFLQQGASVEIEDFMLERLD